MSQHAGLLRELEPYRRDECDLPVVGKVFHHFTRVLQYPFELRLTFIEQQEHGHPCVAAWISEYDPISRKPRMLSYPELQVLVAVRIINPLRSEKPLLLLHIPAGGMDRGSPFIRRQWVQHNFAVGVDVRKTQLIKRRQ